MATLRNTWLPATNLNATLTSSDPSVQITDNAGAFGVLSSGQSASNTANPFGVTLAGNTPYSRNLAFTLNLSGAGGYTASVPLVVQVRSSIQEVEGRISVATSRGRRTKSTSLPTTFASWQVRR